MPYTAWPTTSDLQTALGGRSIALLPGQTGAGYIGQAVREWERLTAWPFLSPESAASVLWDAPYSARLLFGRWMATVTAVAIGCEDLSDAGQVLTLGSDYRLLKHQLGPIYGIEFASELIGSQDQIKVTGLAGWSQTLPDEAYEAVLEYAASLCTMDIGQSSGVVQSIKQGDVEMRFAETVEHRKTFELAKTRLKAAAQPYRIWTV